MLFRSVFVNKAAKTEDSATIVPELLKLRPLANMYELHNLEVRASGRIGGVNIEGSYKFTFDDDNTIRTAEVLGETLPEEIRPMVEEGLTNLAKAMRPAHAHTSDEEGLFPLPFGQK